MKKALITGANRSIGFEVARQLLEAGFYVYLGSRSLDKGQQAVEQLKRQGFSNVEAVEIDVTDTVSVEKARAEVGRKTEALDVLINNAGISAKCLERTD